MRALKYFLNEATESLLRSWRSASLAVLTIAAGLFVLGFFLMINSNLQRVVGRWSEAAEMSVYLKDDATKEQVQALEALIAQSGLTDERRYLSKADALTRFAPDQYVATMSKAKRRGKIFVDYLRNSPGATFVAPYSTRARPGAPIATPVAWSELPEIDPSAFTLRSFSERLALKDPWRGLGAVRQRLSRARSNSGCQPISGPPVARQSRSFSSVFRDMCGHLLQAQVMPGTG